jgi:hypothetical protein
VLDTDYTVVSAPFAATRTVTMPANPTPGQVWNIACFSNGNPTILDLNGENFYGSSSDIKIFNGENLKIQYDGSRYIGA